MIHMSRCNFLYLALLADKRHDKTVALTEPLKTALEPYADKIKTAFVYGSVAKGTDNARSDIDLMVIGDDLNYSDLYTALQDVEDRVRRTINPMFPSFDQWRRRSSKDGFFAKSLVRIPSCSFSVRNAISTQEQART